MIFHDKKEIRNYILCCAIWSVTTICIQSKMLAMDSLNDFCLFYWRGFESIGASLFWWLAVQLPVYGGIIFFLKKWKCFAIHIHLKKGNRIANQFFISKIITMTGSYYGIHLVLVLCLSKLIINNAQSGDATMLFAEMAAPSSIIMLYTLQFLNGILFTMTVFMLYIIFKNEYLSFIVVLCVHVIVNILGINVSVPSAYIWTMSGNILAWIPDFYEWQYFIGSVFWIVVLIVLVLVCLKKRQEYFWG